MRIDATKIESLGKPGWSSMLRYVADLHAQSIRPAIPPFPHAWEDIGPGYCYGPAFGHWDIVHAILDVLPFDPAHARRQIENNLAGQQEDGLLPGAIYIREGKAVLQTEFDPADAGPRTENNLAGEQEDGLLPGAICMREGKADLDTEVGHPPVWPFAVQDYVDIHGPDILPTAYAALVRQIRWFEQKRKAQGQGFFYTDILNHKWESGVDEGIRFLEAQTGPFACVDATSHVFALYTYAQRWAQALGEDSSDYEGAADTLKAFIQDDLFVEETGYFHDIWAVQDPALRCFAFEGMWPMVVGAATPEQARRVIEENLLNPKRFYTEHPLATVSVDDPRFELRMWRGPAWNSMTYWAARGCMNYGEFASAAALLERALDDSAVQFERTGTIWEFYHPHGGRPEDVQRKPATEFNTPCRDYLGHNPLLAMALLYDQAKIKEEVEHNDRQISSGSALPDELSSQRCGGPSWLRHEKG